MTLSPPRPRAIILIACLMRVYGRQLVVSLEPKTAFSGGLLLENVLPICERKNANMMCLGR